MSYNINDKALIEELCGIELKTVIENEKAANSLCKDDGQTPLNFVHPLDGEIITQLGNIKALLKVNSNTIPYSAADTLDKLWRTLARQINKMPSLL